MRCVRAGLSLGITVGIFVATVSTAQALGGRSLWVWEGPIDGVVEFADANGISELYLHAPPGFSEDERYAPFIEDAHAAGLDVSAMAGDPQWARDARTWREWVDEVVEFGTFDGLVFDVEPYLHPDWGTSRQNRLIRSYLTGLDAASRHAGSLPTFTAIPFWWDEPVYVVQRTPLFQHVLDRSDGIIVMAYRDRAAGSDGIINLSRNEALVAASMGRGFVIGVETGPAGLDKVSFAEEGAAFMEGELQTVEEWLAGVDGLARLAIHDYASFTSMAPGPQNTPSRLAS